MSLGIEQDLTDAPSDHLGVDGALGVSGLARETVLKMLQYSNSAGLPAAATARRPKLGT